MTRIWQFSLFLSKVNLNRSHEALRVWPYFIIIYNYFIITASLGRLGRIGGYFESWETSGIFAQFGDTLANMDWVEPWPNWSNGGVMTSILSRWILVNPQQPCIDCQSFSWILVNQAFSCHRRSLWGHCIANLEERPGMNSTPH